MAEEWTYTYSSGADDQELRAIDVACQVIGDDRLSESERGRILHYLVDRYGS